MTSWDFARGHVGWVWISLRLKNPWRAQVYSADVAEVAAGSSVVCDQGVPWLIMIHRLPPQIWQGNPTYNNSGRKIRWNSMRWDLGPAIFRRGWVHALTENDGILHWFFLDSCLFQQFTPIWYCFQVMVFGLEPGWVVFGRKKLSWTQLLSPADAHVFNTCIFNVQSSCVHWFILTFLGLQDTVQLVTAPSQQKAAYSKFGSGPDTHPGVEGTALEIDTFRWQPFQSWEFDSALLLIWEFSKAEDLVIWTRTKLITQWGVCDSNEKFDKFALQEEPVKDRCQEKQLSTNPSTDKSSRTTKYGGKTLWTLLSFLLWGWRKLDHRCT